MSGSETDRGGEKDKEDGSGMDVGEINQSTSMANVIHIVAVKQFYHLFLSI